MDKRVSFPVKEEDHRKLKMLAAKEGKSLKQLIFDALSKVFPDWQKNK